jgi:alpha-1,6-mannosyltransferase
VIAAMTVAAYSVYLSAGKMVFGFLGGYAQEEGLETGTRYFLLQLVQHVPGLHGVGEKTFLGFAGAVMLGICVWAWRVATPLDAPRMAFLRPAFALAVAMMLLFSPHYPWYIAWLIPFLTLMPNLPVLTYVGMFFYLCTTMWATGTGWKQYHLNEILYASIGIAVIMELLLRKLPWTRGWFRPVAGNLNGDELPRLYAAPQPSRS